MTDKEILTKAIEKAVKRGFVLTFGIQSLYEKGVNIDNRFWNGIIFDQQFAKAFWGEEEISIFDHFEQQDAGDGYMEDINVDKDYISWQYHLQQQVISDNPIQYLAKGL